MSNVEAFDLGMRLRAASTATVQSKTAHTTVLRVAKRVALDINDDMVTVHPEGGQPASGKGREGLALLAGYTPQRGATMTTAVVRTKSVLARLRTLAADSLAPGDSLDGVGMLLDWWQQRAEHPDSQSVVTVLDACRTRWVTGDTPADERRLATWRQWLGVRADGTGALLAITGMLTDGVPNPVLELNVRDGHEWMRLTQRSKVNWDWRRPDGDTAMAVGLATREASESLWTHALLSDPAVEARERHTGRIVTGVVDSTEKGSVVIKADTSCRHRIGKAVRVTVVKDRYMEGEKEVVTARVEAVRVERRDDGDAMLVSVKSIGRDAKHMFGLIGPGDPIKVMPEAVDTDQSKRGIDNVASQHNSTRSWVRSKSVVKRPGFMHWLRV